MSFFLLLLLRPLSLHWMIYGLVGSFSLILNTLNQILLLMLLHNAQTHKTGRNNGEKDFGVSKSSTIPSALFVFVLLQFNWMTWSTRSCEWHIIVVRDHYRSCNFSNLSKISLIEKKKIVSKGRETRKRRIFVVIVTFGFTRRSNCVWQQDRSSFALNDIKRPQTEGDHNLLILDEFADFFSR